MTNYFDAETTARRYARSRPYFHPHVVDRLKADGITARHALDVGCGTGLSTRALLTLAGQVTGIDLSAAMLQQAEANPRIAHVQSSGERLPFQSGSFDLVAVSSTFHWLDRAQFMREASRVLTGGGWLIVYDNYFTADMREDSSFQTAFRAAYYSRYPGPKRGKVEFAAREGDFERVRYTEYENDVRFTLDALIDYLTTQSNAVAALESGETLDSLRDWSRQRFAPYFAEGPRTFRFRGPIWQLRKLR